MKLLPLVFLVLAGCQESGRLVTGTFHVDGKPKAGVKVYLTTDWEDFSSCGTARPSATTDTSGEFTARASKFPMRPCFVVDDVTYSTFFIVDDGSQREIRLVCSLPLIKSWHFEDGHICQSVRQ